MNHSYFKFENSFRGSREQIKDKLSFYDELLDSLLTHNEKPNVLDIACGRGEWLEKCINKGFAAQGIEINSEMVSECKKFDIDVTEGDALEILKTIPSNSILLVSSFHLIEHLKYDDIIDLFLECKRIVKDEGICLFETPNIDNLIVSTKSFYCDPTHINHINADSTKYFLNHIGFEFVDYYYINGGPLEKETNFTLTRVLNGVAQDLLLIGIPSIMNSQYFAENSIKIDHLFNKSISTFHASEEFDNQLTTNIFTINNDIELLKNKIFLLEKANKDLIHKLSISEQELNLISYRQNRIYNSFLSKSYRKFKRILIGSIFLPRNILILILKIIYKSISKVPFFRRILFSSKSQFIMKIMAFILSKLGQEKYALKLIKQCDQNNSTETYSSSINTMLSSYYKVSKKAKENYKMFNK